MIKYVYLLASLLVMHTVSSAQSIKGIVMDDNGTALEKATVSLLKAGDSSLVKFTTTAADGTYTIETTPGSYLIKATFVGHKDGYSTTFQLAGKEFEVPAIILEKLNAQLENVVVVSQRPIIEVKADKTVLNVEGTINAVGNDGLELLRKAPGVMIDKDDNISLAGKNGVQIFVDGKPTPFAGSDLANFLKSMDASQIDNIEIITNPSARYEAAGNAGIINIRLKKNKAFGTNGSFTLGYGIGTYAKYNGGVTFNHRNKNINVFGNYNYRTAKNAGEMEFESTYPDTIQVQHAKSIFKIKNGHNFKTGLDYFIDNKSTIGTVITGNINRMENNSNNPLEFYSRATNTKVRQLKASNSSIMNRENVNFNLNYRYSLPNSKDFSIDLDYGFFNNETDQQQPNVYYLGDGITETHRNDYHLVSPSKIDIYSFKTDYEQNWLGGKLGVGAKFGFVNTDNDFQRYNVISNVDKKDSLNSNRFDYKENINAVYANYNKQIKTFLFQVGLRLENTQLEGTSTGFEKANGGNLIPFDSTFKRSYTNLFPSAAITFNKNPMNQWTLSASRRIDRPAYQDLNPFKFMLNEYTYMQGNINLKPQFTNSVGITNIFRYRLTTSLNYSHVKDIFASIPDTIDGNKGFMTRTNLNTQDVFALNISYPFQKGWYSFFANASSNYSIFKGNFGGGDRNVNLKAFTFQYYMQNTFKLGKGWTAEVSGFFISPSVWQGVMKANAMGSVDLGLQKTLMDGKGTLRFVMGDAFQTMKWGGSSDFTGVKSTMSGKGEMPVFRLNFSYRFGSNTVKQAAQRKFGSEEERQRAEGGGQQQGGVPSGNK